MYVDVKEVMHTLGVSRNKAYKIIQLLNEELKTQGYVVIAGKCSRKYFNEKFYGYDSQTQNPKGEI
jgi:transcriptional antiterminator